MKQFKFRKISIPKIIGFLGIAVVCLSLSNFNVLAEENSVLNTLLNLFAYLIIALHFVHSLWFKYYVSYNKKALTIRCNRNLLEERTFEFKHVKDVSLKEKEIHFKYRNKEQILNLDEFQNQDIIKIESLLKTKL